MPRVNGQMQPIPNAYGAPGATLESAKYNSQLDDFIADANTPRPIAVGGTGGTSAATAREALGIADAITTTIAAKAIAKAGDAMVGQLTSAVIAHGSLGAVTEEYKYANTSAAGAAANGANTHSVTVAATSGTHTINPTGLVEGGVMQVNVLYQSGSIAVSGTTLWELGGGEKSTAFADLGITLTAGRVYRLYFEMAGGVRTGIFQ